jgi:uncharacterized protein
MKFGLKQSDIDKIHAVFSAFPQIETVIIYGSRAKDRFKTGSDIDLSLIGHDLNLNLFNRLNHELDDLMLPYTFDISILEQITNLDLLGHIDRVGKVFYQRSRVEQGAGLPVVP